MHDYEPGCSCDYCRTMDKILKHYQSDKREAFRRMYSDDPFSTDEIKTYFCQSCQGYHREGFVHTQTGRFKVNRPSYEQKRRSTHPGRYRRIYSNEFDWIEWQYKPWPEAEWVIYYKVSAEMIKREVATIGTKLAGKKFHTAASEALSKERYHKIERIDAPA